MSSSRGYRVHVKQIATTGRGPSHFGSHRRDEIFECLTLAVCSSHRTLGYHACHFFQQWLMLRGYKHHASILPSPEVSGILLQKRSIHISGKNSMWVHLNRPPIDWLRLKILCSGLRLAFSFQKSMLSARCSACCRERHRKRAKPALTASMTATRLSCSKSLQRSFSTCVIGSTESELKYHLRNCSLIRVLLP